MQAQCLGPTQNHTIVFHAACACQPPDDCGSQLTSTALRLRRRVSKKL